MGSGALLQMSATGAQDIFLTASPDITFFKIRTKKFTPFAIESIEQTFNGTVGFNRKISTIIVRNGDLAADMYLEVTLTKNGPTYYPLEALVGDVVVNCGGQQLDKHYAGWFRMFDEMYRLNDEKVAYRRMSDFAAEDPVGASKKLYLPLIFFFNRMKSNALPMVALQYHDIMLNFTLGAAPTGIDPTVPPTASLWVDYVFLDVEERRRFAQIPHEYLIDQVQHTGPENAIISGVANKSQQIRLNYNHPVTALLWNLRGSDHGITTTGPKGTKNDSYACLDGWKLTLNGTDRDAARSGAYFNQVTPFKAEQASSPDAGYYMYPFALKPREYQPSGSCNFSRIDNATMSFRWKQAVTGATAASDILSPQTCPGAGVNLSQLDIWAHSLNWFRVAGGMGGVAFAS